jgi:hypothetical protein
MCLRVFLLDEVNNRIACLANPSSQTTSRAGASYSVHEPGCRGHAMPFLQTVWSDGLLGDDQGMRLHLYDAKTSLLQGTTLVPGRSVSHCTLCREPTDTGGEIHLAPASGTVPVRFLSLALPLAVSHLVSTALRPPSPTLRIGPITTCRLLLCLPSAEA